MIKKIIIILVLFVSSSSVTLASEVNDKILQTFQKILVLPKIEIAVPTIIEMTIPNEVYSSHFAVYNQAQDRFEPYTTLSKTNNFETKPQAILSNPTKSNTANVFDDNFGTFTQFDIDENGNGYVEINYTFSQNIKSTSLYVSLEPYVSLPNSITIKTIENGQEKIIVSKIRPTSNIINFVETNAKNWKLEIYYSQPLRINELQIKDLSYKQSPRVLRFLAQPNREYVIYAEPDLIMDQQTGERPNFYSNEDIKMVQVAMTKENNSYILADTDSDGVADINDNCVNTSNPNQEDINKNNRGDVCDDFDKDGVINAIDNCINEPNADQKDTDLDQIGDACDDEESRFTEKYPEIVWGGILFAGLLFFGLFAVALIRVRRNKDLQSAVENQDTGIPRI